MQQEVTCKEGNWFTTVSKRARQSVVVVSMLPQSSLYTIQQPSLLNLYASLAIIQYTAQLRDRACSKCDRQY
jgi:hypothetical protein